MTDHAAKLAEALERVLDQLQDYQEGRSSEEARDALAAYRAQQEQAEKAIWTPEQVESVHEWASRVHGKVQPRPEADEPTEPQAGKAGEVVLPPHPEPMTMRWSELEEQAIRQYGDQREAAALEKVRTAWMTLPTWVRARHDVANIRAIVEPSSGG